MTFFDVASILSGILDFFMNYIKEKVPISLLIFVPRSKRKRVGYFNKIYFTSYASTGTDERGGVGFFLVGDGVGFLFSSSSVFASYLFE